MGQSLRRLFFERDVSNIGSIAVKIPKIRIDKQNNPRVKVSLLKAIHKKLRGIFIV